MKFVLRSFSYLCNNLALQLDLWTRCLGDLADSWD